MLAMPSECGMANGRNGSKAAIGMRCLNASDHFGRVAQEPLVRRTSARGGSPHVHFQRPSSSIIIGGLTLAFTPSEEFDLDATIA